MKYSGCFYLKVEARAVNSDKIWSCARCRLCGKHTIRKLTRKFSEHFGWRLRVITSSFVPAFPFNLLAQNTIVTSMSRLAKSISGTIRQLFICSYRSTYNFCKALASFVKTYYLPSFFPDGGYGCKVNLVSIDVFYLCKVFLKKIYQ